MTIAKQNIRMIITIPKVLKDDLQEAANKEKRSMSNLCIKVLSDYLSMQNKNYGSKKQ